MIFIMFSVKAINTTDDTYVLLHEMLNFIDSAASDFIVIDIIKLSLSIFHQ